MINVGDILADQDLAQRFVIHRSTGSFQLGGWQDTVTTVTAYGAVIPTTDFELQQVPEGDRVTGAMTFWTQKTLYETRGADSTAAGLSDIIAWRGQCFRLVKIFPYSDYGFCKGIGVRMSGE